MTTTELRRAATELLNDCDCGQNGRIVAQYVLDIVQKDDDVPLGFNYVVTHPSITQSCMKYSCGTITIRGMELELHSYNLSGDPCYLIGRDGLRLETRGQLRRLLEGLGLGVGQ